jgi:hypothetical protein
MERIETEVRRELARFGPSGSIARLVEVWPAVVGESIARNAWPGRVSRDGTLHVATTSSAWAFELSQLAPKILARLREELGEDGPKALRFAPGPLPEPAVSEESRARPSPPVVSAETRNEADRLAASIADGELRALVGRAAAASLEQAAGDRPV